MFFAVRKCVRISVSKYLWRNAVGNLLSKGIEAEEQRTGRNKETSINHTYIEGGEFRKKFDSISDDKELNKLIYTLAKQMLIHRSGTLYEDMYWIDYDECEVVAKEIDSRIERKIIYSDATKKVIEAYKKSPDKTLITIHSHPSSFPPSIDDFMANYDNDYTLGLVVCHNGSIFMYAASEAINSDYYNLVVADYIKDGYNDYEAQIKAINELQKNFDIIFKEVVTL